MQRSRRRYLATFATMTGIIVSGCVSDETVSSREGSRDRDAKSPDTVNKEELDTVSGPGPGVLANESTTIEEGNFVAYDFTISSETQFNYEINVENNVRIDLFVISTRGFVRYKSDQFISPIATTEATDGDSGKFVIPKGNYYFVIDNTKKLGAKPPGQLESVPAKVDIKISY